MILNEWDGLIVTEQRDGQPKSEDKEAALIGYLLVAAVLALLMFVGVE